MEANNKTFSVRDIFSEGTYLIPIYQRNYAWDTFQVKLLIQDTADYAANHPEWNYYIGTLIVLPDARRDAFETIDGQQRLTTLYIILCALKHWPELGLNMDWFSRDRLTFDNRENSCRSLHIIHDNPTSREDVEEYEEHIVSIYDTIRPAVESVCSGLDLDVRTYVGYLLSKVRILRIEVPDGINKNHYFEVMNSRGVQLEQHEVVKASLMAELQESPEDMAVFGRIWDACSYMERYVQMNFYPDERRVLFGDDWKSQPSTDFDAVVFAFPKVGKAGDGSPRSLRTMLDTLEQGGSITGGRTGKAEGRLDDDPFYSVVNFQNFLLHVLKVYRPHKDIRLDDKQLTDTFLKVLADEEDKAGFVKGFAVCLLRCRFLFDRYVVRRQNDRWCLKKFISSTTSSDGRRRPRYVRTFGRNDDEEDNLAKEEAIVLLSMFHVSTPTMIYKNWLHGVLHFLYWNASGLTAEAYVAFLRRMAAAFMLDRYLVGKEKTVDFMDIIYKDDCKAKNALADADWSLLNKGVGVENFVFNFYDYLLWKDEDPDRFEFSYRNSVEHFYPQHPSNPADVMKKEMLDMFGNLCLVSSGINSKFTNNMPAAKLANFKDMDTVVSQSLKLQDMFKTVGRNQKERPDGSPWTVEDIKEASQKAIELFKQHLNRILQADAQG